MHSILQKQIKMKKAVVLYILLMAILSCEDSPKIYFDVNWNETTKENASYYRDIPKLVKDQWIINDYYITGEKQFIGQAIDSLGTQLDGYATWYYKSGSVINKAMYRHGELVAVFNVRAGAKGSEKEGWNESDLVLVEQQNASLIEDAADTSTNENEYYYTNTFNVAIRHTSKVGFEAEFSFTAYFNKKGEQIARLDYNEDAEKWVGQEVIFEEEELRGKNGMNRIKEIRTYNRGTIIQKQFFNASEKLVAQCTFKDDKPLTGTFLKEICGYTKIQTYESSMLDKEDVYNAEAIQIAELNYKENAPETGVFYDCEGYKTYKNGKLNGTAITYLYDEAESIGSEFNYKDGVRDGDYTIYEDASKMLERGTFKDGKLMGEVTYFHHQVYVHEALTDNYYIKTNVTYFNNKPFISELSQFNLEDGSLLKTFPLEKTDTDDFNYLESGYHEIRLEDLNGDGVLDLHIFNSHHEQDFNANSYYVFNPKTNKYKHLDALENADMVEVNAQESTITATFVNEYEDQSIIHTYGFSGIEMDTIKSIASIYHREIDTIVATQIYPHPVNTYPLLNKNLPPLKISQDKMLHEITTSSKEVVLKKEPFSIVFPGMAHDASPFGFNVKITATYDKGLFENDLTSLKAEDVPFFKKGTTYAAGGKKPLFIIDESGHNILYYDETAYATLSIKESIHKKLLLLEYTIEKIFDEDAEKTIYEIEQPIYLVVYIDKNQNLKIDEEELFYLTLNFE